MANSNLISVHAHRRVHVYIQLWQVCAGLHWNKTRDAGKFRHNLMDVLH